MGDVHREYSYSVFVLAGKVPDVYILSMKICEQHEPEHPA